VELHSAYHCSRTTSGEFVNTPSSRLCLTRQFTGQKIHKIGLEAHDSRSQEGAYALHPLRKGELTDQRAASFLWADSLQAALTHYESDYLSEISLIMSVPTESRPKACEVLFEQEGVGQVILQSQELFGLLDKRLWTGLSVHLGGGYSSIVPFYNGCEISHASQRLAIGGEELSGFIIGQIPWADLSHKWGRMDDRTKQRLANTLKMSYTIVPDMNGSPFTLPEVQKKKVPLLGRRDFARADTITDLR
jgi:hypothetical protein